MFCRNCGQQIPDNAQNCPNCGTPQQAAPQPQMYQQAPAYDPFDHTAEFDPQDVSENKVICMLVYLVDVLGILYALLAASSSRYAAFHVRQAMKFTVLEILTAMCMLLLVWTVIVPIVGAIFLLVLTVVKIICFVQVCSGKAKEPPIVRSFTFLK